MGCPFGKYTVVKSEAGAFGFDGSTGTRLERGDIRPLLMFFYCLYVDFGV